MATTPFRTQFPYSASTEPGVGPYGSIPNQLTLPPSTYEQAVTVNPQLAQSTAQASNNIGLELQGELTPAMKAALQDTSAAWGTGSGLGFGSGVGQNNWDTSRLLATQGYQQQGLSNYLNFSNNLESGQLPPGLESQIQAQNAVWAASPDPAMVHQELQKEASKGQVGKTIGSAIGGLIGTLGGAQGVQVGSQLGGQIGYTAGGGVSNPGAGVGGLGYQSALGAVGSGYSSSPFSTTPTNALTTTSTSAGGANPSANNWWQNPSSDPYNAMNYGGPSGGTGDFTNPFSSVGGGGSTDAEFGQFAGMLF